nr:hypothetical protein [uncultured Rhodoferax sp.]
MIRVITIGVLLPAMAWAQAPIQFSNSPKAIKQYESSTLESLVERCSVVKAEGYKTPEEVRGLRNGFVDVVPHNPQTGLYSVFVFDQDKRSFVLVDGQLLSRDKKLSLRLVLPRDYGRCRLVRTPQGAEMLEVVHTERNYVSDIQRMQKLSKELMELHAAAAQQPAACGAAAGAQDVQFLEAGNRVSLNLCHEATAAMVERLRKTVRKVHER